MPKINLPQIPGWESLTESERYWAGVMGRQIEDKGMVANWHPTCANQIEYDYNKPGMFGDDKMYCWVRDALLCALTHQEPLIAFRALLQAEHYRGENRGCDGSTDDAARVAKARVEGMLK